jgi:hypothetical protein
MNVYDFIGQIAAQLQYFSGAKTLYAGAAVLVVYIFIVFGRVRG